MPRKGPARKRKVEVDPVYGSSLLAKLINRSMYDGKKSVARKEVYGALKIIADKTKEDALVVFQRAIEQVKPEMEVRPRRVGGAAYQVPQEVRGTRKVSLAIRWLLEATRKKPNTEFKTFSEKLAAEITAALNNEGEAIRKRDTVHKMADANKAFAHFRF